MRRGGYQRRDHELFGLALGLEAPWAVTEVRFDVRTHRLDLTVDFTEGSRFPCPVCGHAACLVYDTRIRTWRHLDFFQHQTYLTARVPRVKCPSCAVIAAARTLKRHWSWVLAFIRSRITNGIVKGLTSKIKTALKRAYGFKTFENYRTIIYLVAGKLELPTRC